jgi:hypothetical protein
VPDATRPTTLAVTELYVDHLGAGTVKVTARRPDDEAGRIGVDEVRFVTGTDDAPRLGQEVDVRVGFPPSVGRRPSELLGDIDRGSLYAGEPEAPDAPLEVTD